MKVVFTIVLSLLALLAGGVLYLDWTERRESYFKTYEEVRGSDLIDKGWVPDFIPRSAYDIYEKHRVDIGRVNITFRFTPGDTAQVEEACARRASEEPGVAFYNCKHGNDMVIVKLSENGRGEIFSEKNWI